MALLRRLSLATAAATLALVAAGGIVRASGSGLGCPDWPRCHGRLLPPLEFHPLVEYSHRALAAIVVVLVVATAWVAWRRGRHDPGVLWPAVGAVGVVLAQAALGAVVVGQKLNPIPSTIHFATALLLATLTVVTATNARLRRANGNALAVEPGLRRALWWAIGTTALLLLAGVYVRGAGAGLAFDDWPLMDGRVLPDLTTRGSVASFVHRALALGALAAGGVLALRARRLERAGPRRLAWAFLSLLLVQAGLGAAAVLSRLSTVAVAGHVAVSSVAWASLVSLAAALRRLSPRATEATPARRVRELVAAYVQLTKPDIVVLLLVTTVPAMVLAAGGMPPAGLIAATLLGGALAAGGAGAVNCYLDRDIDERMARTRGRPIPTHRVAPERALGFGLALVGAGTVWLWIAVNALAAALTLAAAAFYVVVYTLWLKPTTPQNIVIGGAAGAVPALVGWAAVTGEVGLPAVVLFAIVFVWTPPHFWALSLRYAGDYAAAGVPMLPVVAGRAAAARQILAYSVLLVGASLALTPVAGMGALYLTAAVVLGGVFVGQAVRVVRDSGTRAAMGLFRYSITYLGLLFAAAAADQLVRSR